MKKKHWILFAFLCVLALCLSVSACAGEIVWEDSWGFEEVEGGYKVYRSPYGYPDTDITVPNSCNGKKVVALGNNVNAFLMAHTIRIPDSVRSIDELAFMGNKYLTAISPYPGPFFSVTRLDTDVFLQCTALSKGISGLIKNVTYFGDHVFYECSSIESVELSDHIQHIGSALFKKCYRLKNVRFTKSSKITSIPEQTFYKCEALKSFDIPSQITAIGKFAFYKSGLASITLHEKVEYLDEGAFGDCADLRKAVILNKDCRFHEGAFTSSAGLTLYGYEGSTAQAYAAEHGLGFKVLRRISFKPAGGAGKMAAVQVEDGTKYRLPACAFTAPQGKQFVRWDKGAPGTEITVTGDIVLTAQWKTNQLTVSGGVYQLNHTKKTATLIRPADKNIKKLSVPSSVSADGRSFKVTAIKARSFKGLKKLAAVTIGKNVTKIGSSAFEGCKKLKTIVIKNTKMKKSGFGSKCFSSIAAKAVIKVPKSVLAQYKTWITTRAKPPKHSSIKKN